MPRRLPRRRRDREALGTPVVEVATGGVSDASWTADLGIPTLDGLGPIGEDDHSPAERIVVSSIPDRIGLVAGVIAASNSRSARP